ncbi:MAG: SGNH/GDSL hydrolase family protein [Clostridia bacterium]|nr:SGNH/GDSL hydrolase family protein [Clostridia bacterium]
MSKLILFQGDSITDAGRNREDGHISSLGFGYPQLVSGYLGFENPAEYTFINKGISGNRVSDLYSRSYKEIVDLRPDYMSILIGINDVWHNLGRVKSGKVAKRCEKVYDMLIADVLDELPDVKIMILEPFVLEGPATTSTEQDPDRWENFRNGAEQVAAISKKLADKYNLTFVPLQKKLDELATKMPVTDILIDGVHPTAVGHELIKRGWLEGFEKLK